MRNKLQRYERTRFYGDPVCCVFCGHEVQRIENGDGLLKPCTHTLFIAHDEGYQHVADRVVTQLRSKGFFVSVDDGFVEIKPPAENHDRHSPDLVTDDLDFADGLKIASYAGPPGRFGTYVGFAPTNDEFET